MIHKKVKLEKIVPQFLKISLLHSNKIHQNLQPPPRFWSPSPPKELALPVDQKFRGAVHTQVTDNAKRQIQIDVVVGWVREFIL